MCLITRVKLCCSLYLLALPQSLTKSVKPIDSRLYLKTLYVTRLSSVEYEPPFLYWTFAYLKEPLSLNYVCLITCVEVLFIAFPRISSPLNRSMGHCIWKLCRAAFICRIWTAFSLLNIRLVERTIQSELCLFDYMRRSVVHCINLHIKSVKPIDGPLYLKTLFVTRLSL